MLDIWMAAMWREKAVRKEIAKEIGAAKTGAAAKADDYRGFPTSEPTEGTAAGRRETAWSAGINDVSDAVKRDQTAQTGGNMVKTQNFAALRRRPLPSQH